MRARSCIARRLPSSAGAILRGIACATPDATPALPSAESVRAGGYETPPQQRARRELDLLGLHIIENAFENLMPPHPETARGEKLERDS